MGCVSKDDTQKKSFKLEVGKLGSKHTVTFSRGTWHHVKIRERKGPSQGVVQKCEPQEQIPWAPKFEERTQDETLEQEQCARREAWDLANNVSWLKKEEKDTFYSPAEAWVMLAPPSKKKARSSRTCGRLRSVYAHAERKKT